MKRSLKRIIALVCSLAMIITGISYQPKTVSAALSGSCVIGTETTVGVWTYTVIQNQWKNMEATYSGAEAVDGFSFTTTQYGWDGSYWRTSDLKAIYDLSEGAAYNCTVTIEVTNTQANAMNLNVRTTGGVQNIAPESKTIPSKANKTILTWEGTVTPGTEDLELRIGHGNNGEGAASGAMASTTKIVSVEFEYIGTSWSSVPDQTLTNPDGTPWTLYASFAGSSSGAWGQLGYKIEDDADPAELGSTTLKLTSVSGWDAYATYAYLDNYCITEGLQEGHTYTATITLDSSLPTTGSYEDGNTGETVPLQLGMNVAGGDLLKYSLTAGTNTITTPEFTYGDGQGTFKDSVVFWLDGLQKDTELCISDVSFTQTDAGWELVPSIASDAETPFTPDGTPWVVSVIYNATANAWGRMKYQTSTDDTIPEYAKTTFKMVNVSGDWNNWWNFAKLVDYADDLGLEEDYSYTGQITVNSTMATASGKNLICYVDGEQYEFPLTVGENVLEIPEFSFHAKAAVGIWSDDIIFNFEEIPSGAEINISNIEFTRTNASWSKVPSNMTTTLGDTPWTVIATYDADSTWGKMWYATVGDETTYGGTKFKIINSAEGADDSYGNPIIWSVLKLTDYTKSNMDIGSSYIVDVTYDYTPASSGAELTLAMDDINYTFEPEEGTGKTYTTGEFVYSGQRDDLSFMLDSLKNGDEFRISNIELTPTDADWNFVTTISSDVEDPFVPAGTPWTLTAVYDNFNDAWGIMKYKTTGDASDYANTSIKVVTTSGDWSNWWNSAKLIDCADDFGLVEDFEYTGQIVVNTNKATATGKHLVCFIDGVQYDFELEEGRNVLDVPAFSFHSQAAFGIWSDDITFNLDELTAGTELNVESITFTRTEPEWAVVPSNMETPLGNTPWTVINTYDGNSTWGKMWYATDGEETSIGGTKFKMIISAEGADDGYGTPIVWSVMKLAGYAADNMSIGSSYQVKVTYDYTPAKSGAVLQMAVDNTMYDINVTEGTNQEYTTDEFTFSKQSEDIDFLLDGMMNGDIFRIVDIELIQTDAGWTFVTPIVDGDVDDPEEIEGTPWTLAVVNDSSLGKPEDETAWGIMKYQIDGDPADISSMKMKVVATSGDKDNWWNSATLADYATDVLDMETDFEYTGQIVINTSQATEDGKHLYIYVDGLEYEVELTEGRNEIDIPSFYFAGAGLGSDDIIFNFDELTAGTEISIESISFDRVEPEWIKVPANTETPLASTPWTLISVNNNMNTWGKMWYAVEGEPSDIGNTKVKIVNPGGVNTWNIMKLADYLTDKMENGSSYNVVITYDYATEASKGKAAAEMTLVIDNNEHKITPTVGTDLTYEIDEMTYTGQSADVVFMVDKLNAYDELRVKSIAITQTDADWLNVTSISSDDEDPFVPAGTPWTLTAVNNGSNTWGHMKYKVDGDPADPTSTSIKVVTTSGVGAYWWNSASLLDYTETLGMESDFEYTGQIVINSSEATEAGKHLYVFVDGLEYEVDLVEGENTIDIPAFYFQGAESGIGSNDIIFNLDELTNGTELDFASISFERVEPEWVKVPADDDGYTLPETPWTVTVVNNGMNTWGKMWYATDGTASELGGTKMAIVNPGGSNIWNLMQLLDYTTDKMKVGLSYTATITYDYTAKNGVGSAKMPVAIDGTEYTITPTAGTNQTYTTDEFIYGGTNTDVTFFLDKLNAYDSLRITGVEFTKVGNWTRVPDGDDTFTLTSNGLTYYVFAGEWGGVGSVMYYQEEDLIGGTPMMLRMGSGNREPYSSQVKVKNSDAYASLEANRNYYINYKFYSSEAGTAYFTQEGYGAAEKIDVVEGLNVISKKFTYLPQNDTYYTEGGEVADYNLFLELRGMDSGAILSDFSIETSRTDADGWTLVTDSKYGAGQITDDVKGVGIYTNSYYGGGLSYKEEYDENAETSFGTVGIRIDDTSGAFNDAHWNNILSIPNTEVYTTDNHGRALVNGQSYKLKFYYTTTNAADMILTQQGYRSDMYGTYPGVVGENCVGGDNGIEFVYNDRYTVEDKAIMLEISNFPAGTIISNIHWEIVGPCHWSIDGVLKGRVDAGTEITLPTTATVGYLYDGVIYKPGSTFVVNDDVDFTSINDVAIKMLPGAAMQFVTESKGIAFGADFKVNGKKVEDVLNSDAFTTGMLIVPTDMYTELLDEELTLDTYNTYKNYDDPMTTIKNVVNDGNGSARWFDDETGTYRCGITNLKNSNIQREFVAKSYVTIHYADGTSQTIYSGISNSRSVQMVAKRIVVATDYYNSLTDAQKEVVDFCASYME